MNIFISAPFALALIAAPEAGAEDRDYCLVFNNAGPASLLLLAKNPSLRFRSTTLAFWSDFVSDLLRTYCIIREHGENSSLPTLDPQILSRFLSRAGELEQGEAVAQELLDHWWQQTCTSLAREEVQIGLSSFRRFIEICYPTFAQIGRIHFHLAEAPAGSAQPFAFLATVTTKQGEKTRVQHRPLGLVVADSAASEHKELLSSLLAPLAQIAAANEFCAHLLSTKRLFTTAALSSYEAWQLLQAADACERAGIVFKLPRAWGGLRPAPLKLGITIDTQQESLLGFNSLFSLRVNVQAGDMKLSAEEAAALLAGDSGLVSINGQWIAVNREALAPLLAKWQKAEQLHEEGLSFGEALRLLAGGWRKVSIGSDDEIVSLHENSWCDFIAGKTLQTTLDALVSPGGVLSTEEEQLLAKELHASLRPYQRDGLQWLLTLARLGIGGCLADDMGLGKTLQVIALLLLERRAHPQVPNLIVLPASLLANWANELRRFAPSLQVAIVHPAHLSREALSRGPDALLAGIEVVLISFALLPRLEWLSQHRWNLLIVDEAQALKNPYAQQTRTIKKLRARMRLALTGTPLENSVVDLWSIMDFCCPTLLASHEEFRRYYQQAQASDKLDGLRRLLAPYLLRRKKTDKTVIADLPEKIERSWNCLLSPEQVELYTSTLKQLKKSLEDPLAGDRQRRGLILSYLLKFKQICNHPSQLRGDGLYDYAASGKFARLQELSQRIAARGEKLLVFTQFRELCDILAGLLAPVFSRQGSVLHGGVPLARRFSLVEDFQCDRGAPYMVLSLKAGGTGLNLTRASQVIHFDRWWNPGVENQASDRAYRIGQKRTVMVHTLVCGGTIEERIDQMIAAKRSLVDTLVDAVPLAKLTELSNRELFAVLSLDLRSNDDGL